MGIPAANSIGAANVSGTFGQLTTGGKKKANATVPEFLTFTGRGIEDKSGQLVNIGNNRGTRAGAAAFENFDYSMLDGQTYA